jgi:DNA-3-methyladenine glycosylase
VRVAWDGLENSLARLPRGFFERYTPVVARDLLGCRLVRVDDGRRLSGIIAETEAYRGSRDPASHAYVGKTGRNRVMFGEAGHAYVFFAYGFHHCLNVTTEPPGKPGAVLLRAIQPVEGVSEMVRNRGLQGRAHIADGPGRLTQALRVDRSFDDEDFVTSRRLFIESGQEPARIGTSPRIGVSRGKNRRWRFFVLGTPPKSGR